MRCSNCGTETNSNFCPNCGNPVVQTAMPMQNLSEQGQIVCPKCGGTNVSVQILQDSAKTKSRGHSRGLLWKLGRLTLIICTCGLWLLVGRSKGAGKSKTKFKNLSAAVCQSCGYSWKLTKVK